MSVSQHARYQSPKTGSPKWNAAIINIINSSALFLLWQVKIFAAERVYYCCLTTGSSQPFFMEEILTCHNKKSAGLSSKINNGWNLFSCFGFTALVLCMLDHSLPVSLTGTLEKNWAIVNFIRNTCTFPPMTNQNVFSGNGLLVYIYIFKYFFFYCPKKQPLI